MHGHTLRHIALTKAWSREINCLQIIRGEQNQNFEGNDEELERRMKTKNEEERRVLLVSAGLYEPADNVGSIGLVDFNDFPKILR